MRARKILCFGEVLWDCLPDGLFLGGAPVNVAYHLHQLGERAVPLSAIGRDFLGEEIQRRIRQWGMETDGLLIHENYPTGTVIVSLDPSGNASYDIREKAAWDQITVQGSESADAIIYGSLAQRSAHNRESLNDLLTSQPGAMKVFDVNFRPPYDDMKRCWELAARSSLVKLNHEEAARLGGQSLNAYEANAREISRRSGVPLVCVTAGAAGAGLLSDGQWTFENGRDVRVEDTVGAGDSFLAALVSGLLGGRKEIAVILGRACRLAEFVASERGAQPCYDASRFAI